MDAKLPIAISNEKNKGNALSGTVDCGVAALSNGGSYEQLKVCGGLQTPPVAFVKWPLQ
jgi:hypothetical protein